MDVNLLSEQQITALRQAYAAIDSADWSGDEELEFMESSMRMLDEAFPGILDSAPYSFDDDDEEDEDDETFYSHFDDEDDDEEEKRKLGERILLDIDDDEDEYDSSILYDDEEDDE